MKQDVIVIGAGIIGLATAERLLSQGAKVTILERNNAGQESSWAGGGILSPLCPWDYSDDVTRLTSYSAKQFPAWVSTLQKASGIDPEYETSGMLILPPYDSEIAQQWCSMRGVKIEQRAVPDIPLIKIVPKLIVTKHTITLYSYRILHRCVTQDYYVHYLSELYN